MKKKILFTILLLIGFVGVVSAQSVLTGKVVSRTGRLPIGGAKLTLATPIPATVQTDAEGVFTFYGIERGTYRLTVDAVDYQSTELNVKVDVDLKDINIITLASAFVTADLDDSQFVEFDSDTENDAQSTPVSLSASKDVFDNVAGYKFGQMRFRTRGLESNTETVYLNGVDMTDAVSGNSTWSLWSGLNEATRNQESTYATSVSDVGVGGLNGTTNILARASQMRQGLRASVVTASGQYRHRLMLTYASGMQDNGWAYSASVSTRQGGNDFVEGVNYNAWAYFLSAEKKFNDRHQLSFTFFGVPTERGAQMATTEEAYQLTGSYYYNPNVALQGGKMRNLRVRRYHEPVAMVNYFFTPDEKTKIDVAASFRFGFNGYSAMDWYSAADPRPDYYRKLPSYHYYKNDPDKAEELATLWLSDPNYRYLNLDKIYDQNRNSTVANGNAATVDRNGNVINDLLSASRSHYIISERRTDQRDGRLKAQFSRTVDARSKYIVGGEFRLNRTEYYTIAKDLLGGDYWVNVDNFADRDNHTGNVESTMNDLSRDDNYIVRKGDKYGYDYYAHTSKAKLWGLYNRRMGRWEINTAAEASYSSMWREGLYQKGLFPANSKGDSEHLGFFGYTAKLNLNWRPSGNHDLQLSAIAQNAAPNFQDAFLSPRTRNTVTPNLTTEKYYGLDLAYNLRLPWMRMRLSGYINNIKDQSKLISFYDDAHSAFSNVALSGIDSRYMGIELGVQIPITPDLTLSGAASVGDYTYTSNPLYTQTRDNTNEIVAQNEYVFWKGMKIESTPQTALSLGLNYKLPKNIYLSVDAEYFDRMYLSMNPLYRTATALKGRIDTDLLSDLVGFYGPDGVTPELIAQNAALSGESANIGNLLYQENLLDYPAGKFYKHLLLNASIGKTWYIKSSQLGFSFEIKNLTNNRVRTGGFEQMRLRSNTELEGTTGERYDHFDSKYFYLYGTNYYLNIYFRF